MGNASNRLKDFIWAIRKSRATPYVLAVLGILIVSAAGYFILGGRTKTEKTNENVVVNSTPDETSGVTRYIDGVLVLPERANFFPVAVMVENLISIRPQRGLSQANLVYEALAEGGITRFMAIYAAGDEVKQIGPVRSARSYFIDVASELKALYVHAGGSPQALADIYKYKVFDLNQIGGDHPYFWRETSLGVATEHTLFTSSELLARALRDKKADKEGSYQPWAFKDEALLSARPTEEKKITIDFSTYSYQVEYAYRRATNDYLRSQAGEVQRDKNNDAELAAKNVVVQYVSTRLLDEQHLGMDMVGSGNALVFQDGKTIVGTWTKTDRDSRTRFYNADGQEIIFNRGQTWVEIVPTDRSVTY